MSYKGVRIGDLVSQGMLLVADGHRMRNDELGTEGVPFVRGGDIGADGSVNTNTVDHIRFEHLDRIKGKLSQAGDTVFITKGTVGRAGYLRPNQPPVVFSPQVALWRVLNPRKFSSRFIYYFVTSRTFQNALDGVKTHGAMAADYVSISLQHDFRFDFPDTGTQYAIASVLGALDDKIELNRRMNETLEAMARAIFKDWFVDFGPTRAKTEGRKPYLAPDLWSLFPDRLDEHGKPEGWEPGTAARLIYFNPNERLNGTSEAPYIDMASIPTTGSWPERPISRIPGSGARFRNGDTVFARITPCLENGKTAFIQNLGAEDVAWGSTEFIVMRAKAPMPAPYSYLLARDEAFRAHAIRSMTGTSGRQRAQTEALEHFDVTVPEAKISTAFGDAVNPLFQRIKANSEESEILAAVRDLLLPKLMSGEIRVKEAEQMVGGAI